jgi:hypothetical protein
MRSFFIFADFQHLSMYREFHGSAVGIAMGSLRPSFMLAKPIKLQRFLRNVVAVATYLRPIAKTKAGTNWLVVQPSRKLYPVECLRFTI